MSLRKWINCSSNAANSDRRANGSYIYAVDAVQKE